MANDVTKNIATYPLQRDFSSSVRLYFQHWMWRRQLGYLLHPDIFMRKKAKVADVACGTGIWLIDLARDYPEAQLDGFDVSTAQYPSAGWLPQNVTLGTLDIFKPIPEHLRGVYDVVHVGLLVFVVENNDPMPILDNLLSLLKPGGYLQWDEADFGGLYRRSPNQQVSHAALDELVSKLHTLLLAAKGANFKWVRELERYFHHRHVHTIENKFLLIDNDIAHPWTLQHLMATIEFIKGIDQPPGTAIEWWKLYERCAEEVHRGASLRMAMISVVGRKPMVGFSFGLPWLYWLQYRIRTLIRRLIFR